MTTRRLSLAESKKANALLDLIRAKLQVLVLHRALPDPAGHETGLYML
jgi:hypothetical protein